MDAPLLTAALGRFPRFLGKSTLFKIAPLWPFLKLAGVVPDTRYVSLEWLDHRAVTARSGAAFSAVAEFLEAMFA